mmetsp:Transcript_108144/g.304579  ORF Transcript_108144/g.304579 Transcript_108144/m.304579 type:complete len:139 (-) Transcript_108144:117-533(-)
MANTGVSVSDAAVAKFTEFKHHTNTLTYLILRIDDTQIVLEQESQDKDFAAFTSCLPSDDCRFALYKMDFETTDGRPQQKIVSIAWSPDSAKVKSKMVYAGSKDALNRVCVGVSTKITATDLSELTADIVVEACRKFA